MASEGKNPTEQDSTLPEGDVGPDQLATFVSISPIGLAIKH
jgi:hypothetical protein